MEKLIFNPDNKKYYSDEFIKGFECGVERQFNADMEEKTTINFEKTTITDGDLISRTDLLKELEKWDWQELYLPIHFSELVADLPSAEKTAEWKLVDAYRGLYVCSNCRLQSSKYAFCPNCGAKMKERKSNDY